jgi:hypothetical protein
VSSATPAADGRLTRGGTAAVALGSAGFALAVPSDSLASASACSVQRIGYAPALSRPAAIRWKPSGRLIIATIDFIEGFSDETGRVTA